MKFGCFLGESIGGKYNYNLTVEQGKLSINHPFLGEVKINSEPHADSIAAIASLTPTARSLIKRYDGKLDAISFKQNTKCTDQEYIICKKTGTEMEKRYKMVHSGDLMEDGKFTYFRSSLTITDSYEEKVFTIYARTDRECFSHFSLSNRKIPDYASAEFDRILPIMKRKVAKFIKPDKVA